MTLLSSGAGVARLSRSASRVLGRAAAGFHLLRVEGYSQSKKVPGGQGINADSFSIRGYPWRVKYYPNGRDSSNSDYISLYLQLHDFPEYQVQAQYKLSILDHAGNVAYGLPAKTGVFKACRGSSERDAHMCGHEHFIRREDLERREDLIKDDCVVFRCDVGGFTKLDVSSLDSGNSHDDDDAEFIQRCLPQKGMA